MPSQWFPDSKAKKPESFRFKSPSGVWYESQEDYYAFLSKASSKEVKA